MYKKIKFFNALLIIFLSANLIADENYFYDNIIINSDVVEASRTKILFKGNVRITSNEMNIEGNQATFLTEESALIILGTPTNIKIFENRDEKGRYSGLRTSAQPKLWPNIE